MIGSVRVGVRARRASEGASGDAAQGLAGAPGVEESHGEGQGDEGGEERRFGGDGDATDGEEADEPGQLHARAGGHDGAVLPGGVQGRVGLGEDDEVFVALPFAVPAAGHDEEYGEEHEEDEPSSEDEGQGDAGEHFEHRVGHGGELDDGDDGTDGDDQEDGDDVNRDVDAALRSLTGAHSVVAAQLVVPQAVGPGCSIELQGLIGHALTIALSVNFSRLTKQPSDAQLDTFSLVRMRGFLVTITETERRHCAATGISGWASSWRIRYRPSRARGDLVHETRANLRTHPEHIISDLRHRQDIALSSRIALWIAQQPEYSDH